MHYKSYEVEGNSVDAGDAARARDCLTTIGVVVILGISVWLYGGTQKSTSSSSSINNTTTSNEGFNNFAEGKKDCSQLPGYSYLTYANGHTIVQVPGEPSQRDISGLNSDQLTIIANSGRECVPFIYNDPNTGATITWYYIETASLPPQY